MACLAADMRVSSVVAGQLSIGDVCLFIGQSDTGVVAVPGISVSGLAGQPCQRRVR